MKRLLIVEDDLALSTGITLALQAPDYCFETCATCAAALAALQAQSFDLVLLDINLPDGSGLDVLTTLRESSAAPVILLTANDMETDIVAGLALGADDYITKPFSLAILRARVEVQLRRSTHNQIFRGGGFVFDFSQLQFSRDGHPIELSRTEQRLLRLLVEQRGTAVPRERLQSYIWSDGFAFVDENALSVAINRLRSKLGGKPPIKTVYGIGYCWDTQP